jgi:hypothetical protein
LFSTFLAVAYALSVLAGVVLVLAAAGAVLSGIAAGNLSALAVGRLTVEPRRGSAPRVRMRTAMYVYLVLILASMLLGAAAYGQRIPWWPCALAVALTLAWNRRFRPTDDPRLRRRVPPAFRS